MQLEITFSEKQIKEACLEIIKKKFEDHDLLVTVKSLSVNADNVIEFKAIANEVNSCN